LIKTVETRHFEEEDSDFPFRLLSASYGIADARTGPIERRDYECCTVEFVYEGSGSLEIDGVSCRPATNSVYFLHKHSNHRYWPDRQTPWKKMFFVIDGDLMEYLFRAYGIDKIHHIPDCPELQKFFDEMMRLRKSGVAVHQEAAVIFHKFLAEARALVSGGSSCLPMEMIELKNFIDDNLEEKIRVEDYCAKIHRSSAHVIRQFKTHFGVTPYEYLMRRRVESARLLLLYSDLSIKEIASRLRFSDQFYFSNYFKRKTGVSPQHYKKKMNR